MLKLYSLGLYVKLTLGLASVCGRKLYLIIGIVYYSEDF